MARHVLDVSVFQTMLGKGPITSARHYGITVVIWALSLILAVSTKNLGSVLEIFGAFGASVSVLLLAPRNLVSLLKSPSVLLVLLTFFLHE